MTMTHQERVDQALEAAISETHRWLLDAKDRDGKTQAFSRMAGLINQRSPEQIKRMEESRGLV